MKYRKKPVVIEALQWTGTNKKEIKGFAGKYAGFEDFGEATVHLIVKTLEGKLKASIGDYIIQGVDGEFYPCKPDIFKQTYEKVED